MNDRERIIQSDRTKQYDQLCKVEGEVLAAINSLKPDSNGPFTGNASRVRAVTGITIHFADQLPPVEIWFPSLRGLHGWSVSNALTPLFTELRDKIWKEKEKL